jgi:UDP-N-acetylglucosamine acyltransferase
MTIHPLAIVSKDAVLAEDVRVDAFAVVEAHTHLGAGCVIRERAHICAGATLGAKCVIHMNAVIGHVPQDFSYKGGPLKTRLGESVVVRENVTIHGSAHGDGTLVGDHCYLMVGSHIAHDCKLGTGVILTNGALLAGHVEVEDGAFVSGNVLIHQHVKIGRLAMLAGGSRITMDCPPYMIGEGTNAVTALNLVGLRRAASLTDQDRKELRLAHKILYRSNLKLDQALRMLEADFTSPAVLYWVDFFKRPSKRGFCRFRTGSRRGLTDTAES